MIDAINAATVDGVNTGNPGDPATVGVSVVGDTLHFTFSIPRGDNGTNGADGGPVDRDRRSHGLPMRSLMR